MLRLPHPRTGFDSLTPVRISLYCPPIHAYCAVPEQTGLHMVAVPKKTKPEARVTKGKIIQVLPPPDPDTNNERAACKAPPEAIMKTKRTIRILSTGAKGGPGKSFLCKNLSGAAVAAGYAVAVVDFDRQRTLAKWLARREKLSPDKPKIDGYAADPSSLADAHEVLGIDGPDIIFYDTPPSIDQMPEVLKTLAYAADLILIPSAVGITDTESAEVLLKVLREWQRPALVVLNRVKKNSLKTIGIAKKRLNRTADLCPMEIGEYVDFLVADEIGLGATEMDACVGKDDIEAVWLLVARRFGLEH